MAVVAARMPPLPGPDFSAPTGPQRATSDLAQRVKDGAAQLYEPRSKHRVKSLKSSAQQSTTEEIDIGAQIADTMTLIQREHLGDPALDSALRGLIDSLGRETRSSTIRGPGLSRLLKRLWQREKQSTELKDTEAAFRKLRSRLQFGDQVQRDAMPELPQYLNTNLSTIFEEEFDGWVPGNSTVSVTEHSTMVKARMRKDGQTMRIRLSLVADFQTACSNLVAYLGLVSRPIRDAFPEISAAKGSGSILLRSHEDSTGPMILWVYHNMYAQFLLSPPRGEDLSGSFRRPLDTLVERCSQKLQGGCVSNPLDRTTPSKPDVESPEQIKAGDSFEIHVSSAGKLFCDVGYDAKMIGRARSRDTASGRKFTFVAESAGETEISFNVAHPETLNPRSFKKKIQIQ